MEKSYDFLFLKEQGYYVFKTDYGLTYFIKIEPRSELIDSYTNISLNLVEFAFEIDENQKPVADARIESTIVRFVKEYFGIEKNAMVMLFETLDGKHNARDLLFKKWLTKNNLDNFLATINFSIQMHQELEVRGLFLFRADHPQHQEIIEMANAIVIDMQSLK